METTKQVIVIHHASYYVLCNYATNFRGQQLLPCATTTSPSFPQRDNQPEPPQHYKIRLKIKMIQTVHAKIGCNWLPQVLIC